MQTDAAVRIGAGRTILQISLDGTAHLCQLTTYLVMASGFQIYFQQIIVLRPPDEPVMQNRFLAVRHFLIVGIALVLLLITYQIVHQLTLSLPRAVLHHCPIGFLHLTVPEHLVQTGKCLTRFGKNNKTAYGAVQPVCHTEENIAGFLIFLFQVLLHSLRKRRITRLVCLDNLGSGLVDYNDMVVFVYNSHSVRLHIHTTIYLNHLT